MCEPTSPFMLKTLRLHQDELQEKKPEMLGQPKLKFKPTILTAHPETAQRKTLLGE